MSDLTKPRTNDELFLAAISGDYSGPLPKPLTRAQEYLAKIYKNGMSGSGGSGADGFSPTVTVEQTETGATITATDKNGTTSAEIKNGKDGTPADLSAYAKKTDVAPAIESAHTHENKATLDKITAAKFNDWETAVQQIGDIQTALAAIVEVET